MKLSRETGNSTRVNTTTNTTLNGTENKTGNPVIAIQLQLEQASSGRALTLTRELKVRIVAKKFWHEYKGKFFIKIETKTNFFFFRTEIDSLIEKYVKN